MTAKEELLKYFEATISDMERDVVSSIEHKIDYCRINTYYLNHYNKLIGFLMGCKFSFDVDEYARLCRKFNTTIDQLASKLALYGADNNALNKESV